VSNYTCEGMWVEPSRFAWSEGDITVEGRRTMETHDYITLDKHSGKIEKEEAVFYIPTVWRKADVVLKIEATRYRASSGLTDWSVIGREAYGLRADGRGLMRDYMAPLLSDTAKARLTEAHLDEVTAFLDTDEFAEIRRRSMMISLKVVAQDIPFYSTDPADKLRKALAANSDVLAECDVVRLEQVALDIDRLAESLAAL